MARPSGNMLMDLTTLGRTRIGQIVSDGLQFAVRYVAYGVHGFDVNSPDVPVPLNAAAVSLAAEVHRKPISYTNKDEPATVRGKETTYTTIGGRELNQLLGEAGLIAEVTDPGTTGLVEGDLFLLAHAHFPRTPLTYFSRLAIKWPIDYGLADVNIYNGPYQYNGPIQYNG